LNYLSFFEGQSQDDKGWYIADIFAYSDFLLENKHDYIQRIFPTKEESQYSDAPVITDEEIEDIRKSRLAQVNIRALYVKMLQFWKLDGGQYREWDKRKIKRHWNRPGNHNHLRITRVLKSLKLLGLEEEYKDFSMRLAYILELRKTSDNIHISDETAEIWKKNILKN